MVNPEITSNINYCVLLWSEAGTQHKTKFYSGVLTEWTLMKRQNTGSVKKKIAINDPWRVIERSNYYS